jgi:hypothetical protein
VVALPTVVAAGLASYMNVAITDPLQQTGLLAYDDEELLQADAQTLQPQVADTSDASDSEGMPTPSNLFVVAFSRNCSGECGQCLLESSRQRCKP